MTLRQIGVLVAFAAIVSAVLGPELRVARETSRLLLVGLVELPFALMPTTLILMRRGPLKIWFFTFLAAIPLTGLTATLNFEVMPLVWKDRDNLSPVRFLLAVIPDLGLLGLLAFLARVLVPRICPLCGRPALLRDPSVPRSSRFPTRTEPRLCLACGARFRRVKGGSWVDVDALPAEPDTVGLASWRAPILSKKSHYRTPPLEDHLR